MIRKFNNADLDSIMQIWLDTNIHSHSFIAQEYWTGNQECKRLLPRAEVYVYENTCSHQIEGFIGLTDDYIEGIFVREASQSRGIGKQLLDYVKGIRKTLRLNVYQKNVRAIRFYERELFVIHSEKTTDGTGEAEFIMTWSKSIY